MKRSYKLFLLFLLMSLLGLTSIVHAVTFDVADMKFGINGFVDLEYTYMEAMPMVMTMTNMETGMEMEKIMTMDETSTLGQHHLNLLFDVERERSRVFINFQSLNAATSGGVEVGYLNVKEAYGEYMFSDLFKIRAGNFLMPFGIFNEVRYITPLFATVVLPMMYEPPMMYGKMMDGKMYRKPPLTHRNANLMLTGTYLGENMDLGYSLTVGNGKIDEELRLDTNMDKMIGGRIKLTLYENLNMGISYCTVENYPDNEGRNNILGFDVDFTFRDALNLQAEYANDDYEKQDNRHAYYVRATYNTDKYSPFVTYDYFEDKADLLYKKGMVRIGLGTGYNISENVTAKAEYHRHAFSETDGLPEGTDKFNMAKLSLIFVF